jgi:hypothetical protein
MIGHLLSVLGIMLIAFAGVAVMTVPNFTVKLVLGALLVFFGHGALQIGVLMVYCK